MKKIIYTRPDGGCSIVTVAQGSRLAHGVTLPDGTEILAVADDSRPVDTFLRGWPVEGVVADWAETESEWLDRMKQRLVPVDATDVMIVDESDIPTDRIFRNAWRIDPVAGCKVDMDSAREIQKGILRDLRAPKLAALDVEYMKALEAGNAGLCAEIASRKQALRDVTKDQAISAAKTPETLKAAIPEILK